MAISKLILNGQVQMDVTSDTVTAETLVSGITATKNDGTKITGTHRGATSFMSKTITENGTYDATLELATKLSNPYTTITYSYYQNVNSCFKIPITWTSLPEQNQQLKIHNFTVHLEDFKYSNFTETIVTQDVVFTGFPINLKESGGNTSAIRIYEDYIYIGQQWIDNLDNAYIDEVIIEGPGEIDGYNSVVVNVGSGFTVDEIAMRAISGDISGSATSIGMYAFYSCKNLTTASFPSCTSIGTSAFAYCSSLITASFPSCTSIQGSAFHSCVRLTTASFPLCTSIGDSAFAHCYSLTTVSFPSCTSIEGYAFAYCSSLTTMSFPLCLYIGSYAFRSCTRLTTASFPSCTSISMCAFSYCSSLTTANFPLCISIGGSAFYSCSRLTTASFPLCTSISTNVFAYCYSLTTVSFPSCTSIGASAFVYCYNLLSIYLLGSSVPFLSSNAFYSTPIGGRTTSTGGVYGSIFVPASLYNSYITATNWSYYSSRFVSV